MGNVVAADVLKKQNALAIKMVQDKANPDLMEEHKVQMNVYEQQMANVNIQRTVDGLEPIPPYNATGNFTENSYTLNTPEVAPLDEEHYIKLGQKADRTDVEEAQMKQYEQQ